MTLRRKIVALATGSCPDPSINVPFLMNSRGEELVMAVVPHAFDSEVRVSPAPPPTISISGSCQGMPALAT